MQLLKNLITNFKNFFDNKIIPNESNHNNEPNEIPILENSVEIFENCTNISISENETNNPDLYFLSHMQLSEIGIQKALEFIYSNEKEYLLFDKKGRKLNGAAFNNRLVKILHENGYHYINK